MFLIPLFVTWRMWSDSLPCFGPDVHAARGRYKVSSRHVAAAAQLLRNSLQPVRRNSFVLHLPITYLNNKTRDKTTWKAFSV
jgi:hypothetical protein